MVSDWIIEFCILINVLAESRGGRVHKGMTEFMPGNVLQTLSRAKPGKPVFDMSGPNDIVDIKLPCLSFDFWAKASRTKERRQNNRW